MTQVAFGIDRAKKALVERLTTEKRTGDLIWEFGAKQKLKKAFGREAAFEIFQSLVGRAGGALRYKPIASLHEEAVANSISFVKLSDGGEAFDVPPVRILGSGTNNRIAGVSRSLYVASFENASVYGRSSFIGRDDRLLGDFEPGEGPRLDPIDEDGIAALEDRGAEKTLAPVLETVRRVRRTLDTNKTLIGFCGALARVDDQMQVDPVLFDADRRGGWFIEERPAPFEIELDRAFSLSACYSRNFGHWMWQYLPRYAVAAETVSLEGVPIVIDSEMPSTHREAIEMIAADGAPLIEIPRQGVVRVKRLWTAAAFSYPALLPSLREAADWGIIAPHPARTVELTTKLSNRLKSTGVPSDGPERLFLARKPSQHRKLVNYDKVKELLARHGVVVVYAQDHSLREQLRLVRGAKCIIAPNGSSLLLVVTSCGPGTRLGILTSDFTPDVQVISSMGSARNVDVTVLAGTSVNVPALGPSFADYRTDLKLLRDLLRSWDCAPAEDHLSFGWLSAMRGTIARLRRGR